MNQWKNTLFVLMLCLFGVQLQADTAKHNFRIRTITAGINLSDVSDTIPILDAIHFLKEARQIFINQGYEVQTIRIATQNFHKYRHGASDERVMAGLINLDRILARENVILSIGQILPPDTYHPFVADWATLVILKTQRINFSLPISSKKYGIHSRSIKASAEIIVALSQNSPGGEGNFRFTASANLPPGTPFFPAAYHSGPRSFAIGLESPNVLRDVFLVSDWTTARNNLKDALEERMKPIEKMAEKISSDTGWQYDGIDASPAPGLDASIGEAIESLSDQPFGMASTLSACSLITDVLKSLDVRICGYSGLMLPVIEDKILARRAAEERYTVQELLLFSSVSGTGLDVIPLPGNTDLSSIERLLTDVASLSLKYTNKSLSARLFLIPGKAAGDWVDFKNPFLTSARVMKLE